MRKEGLKAMIFNGKPDCFKRVVRLFEVGSLSKKGDPV